MLAQKGFWSYVRADDEAEGGRVSDLARDLKAQYEILTAESLELFLDKDAIRWGEGWRERLDDGLSSTAFFVAVLTPRYFLSAECRRELQFFARQATQLGVKELLLPVHYIDVYDSRPEGEDDSLIDLVAQFQMEDWRELRFAERRSEVYRRAVARIAKRIVEVNRQIETEQTLVAEHPPGSAADTVDNEPSVEKPGTLDLIAQMEHTLPRITKTIEEITQCIAKIGETVKQATPKLKAEAPMKMRIAILRGLAYDLAMPATEMASLGDEFTTQLHDLDQGVRAAIAHVGDSEAMTPEACKFFEGVRTLSVAAHRGLGAAEQMNNSISPIEPMSRDLRPSLRRVRHALARIVEGRDVTDEWIHLIDDTGLECND